MRMETIDPANVTPVGCWILVREDPPRSKVGLIEIPENNYYRGQTYVKGTVLRIPPVTPRDMQGLLWDAPEVGTRVIYSGLAKRPDTQQRVQEMFSQMEDGSRVFFIHVRELLLSLESEGPGDKEPEVE